MKLSNLVWNQQAKGVPNDVFDGQPGHQSPMQLNEFRRIGYVTILKTVG